MKKNREKYRTLVKPDVYKRETRGVLMHSHRGYHVNIWRACVDCERDGIVRNPWDLAPAFIITPKQLGVLRAQMHSWALNFEAMPRRSSRVYNTIHACSICGILDRTLVQSYVNARTLSSLVGRHAKSVPRPKY